MAHRPLTWLLTLPLVGASVLAGHELAYRLTGVDPGALHAYLDHAPRVLAILVLIGLVGLAVDQRGRQVATAPFAALGALVFAIQEHSERYAHAGEMPLLLGDRAFLLGLLLQVPVGIVAVWIAQRLVRALRAPAGAPARPPLVGYLPLTHVPCGEAPLRPVLGLATPGRGPPLDHRR